MLSDDDKTRTHVALTGGTMISHYRIIEKIGAGGMGEVYLAEDATLDRKVALKFLPLHLCQDAECRARFKREAQATGKLNHPNIVTIFEVSEFNGRPFFAMEHVGGQTLRDLIKDKELTLSRAISLATQVCEGLAKANSAGIVHRDIKPSNILIDQDGRAKIVDFGLASVSGSEQLTKTGSTVGTLGYMSPEQLRGEQVDPRSDLFSFGVVLYELIAGRTPFKRDNEAAILHAILSEDTEPLARYKAEVPQDLQRVVSKCLAKNPIERYQSALDLSADLRSIEQLLVPSPGRLSNHLETARPSIAVLPFTNMSADPENEYFSDGLSEEFLNVLAKNPELRVTGRTSSFAFKGKQEDLRLIGQKLGVETILEGSVRRSGNRVRITAQLIKTTDGFHLWSETYDRVLDDIFAVQDEIAGAVAAAMNVALLGKQTKQRAINPKVYELVLRARQSAMLMTKQGLNMAVDLYRKAIDLDPDDARAWAGLSRALLVQVGYGHADYRVVGAEAKNAAQKAIALDDHLPEAHHALAGILASFELRFDEAAVEHRRAYELAPNLHLTIGALASCEAQKGNFDEALRLRKLATAVDPINPSGHFSEGRLLLWANRLDEARESFTRALELSPNLFSAHLNLSWVALLQGKAEEALAIAQREQQEGYRNCGAAMAYHALGRSADSDQSLDELLKFGEEWSFQKACVYAYRGEADKAFEYLERGVEIRDQGLRSTKVTPMLRTLHADPRWLVFLKKIGLEK